MRNESEACTIIKNSFIHYGGECYKIPDPSSTFNKTIQRPFDLIGVYKGRPLYAEVKHMNKLAVFDLGRIEDHQIDFLTRFKKIKYSICLVLLTINVSRTDKRLYIFDDLTVLTERKSNKSNIKKKELESLIWFPIKKGIADLTNLEGSLTC